MPSGAGLPCSSRQCHPLLLKAGLRPLSMTGETRTGEPVPIPPRSALEMLGLYGMYLGCMDQLWGPQHFPGDYLHAQQDFLTPVSPGEDGVSQGGWEQHGSDPSACTAWQRLLAQSIPITCSPLVASSGLLQMRKEGV